MFVSKLEALIAAVAAVPVFWQWHPLQLLVSEHSRLHIDIEDLVLTSRAEYVESDTDTSIAILHQAGDTHAVNAKKVLAAISSLRSK